MHFQYYYGYKGFIIGYVTKILHLKGSFSFLFFLQGYSNDLIIAYIIILSY